MPPMLRSLGQTLKVVRGEADVVHGQLVLHDDAEVELLLLGGLDLVGPAGTDSDRGNT